MLAYLAAIGLGRLATLEGSGLSLFWPAAGVSALWMLRGRTGREVLLDVALLFGATTALFMVLGLDPLAALAFGVANTSQGFAVRYLRARWRDLSVTGPLAPGVTGTRDLLELIAACVAASIVSAPLGMTGLWLIDERVSAATTIGWVIRNSCGAFVVAAVALTVMTTLRDRSRPSTITPEPRPYADLELVLATAMTALTGALVFSASTQRPIAYVMIATSTWIGFRFSPLVGALHTLGFGTVAILCTIAGWGPFGAIVDPGQRAIAIQVFIAISATIVLLLAFGASERIALTTRLRKSEARASERADLVDAVTTVMTDGLSVIDAKGRILLSNPAAVQMVGLSAGDPAVANPSAHGVFQMDGTPAVPDDLPRARALRGEVVPPMDLLRIDPVTGLHSILSVSGSPLQTMNPDSPGAAVIVMRDVTQARTQRRELESFAGVVAHDLKSPLTGVISWAEILSEQLTEPDALDVPALRASVERIRASAGRMDMLIADLLNYSQTQNAELTLQSVSLDEMVDQIAQDLGDTHHQEIPVVAHPPLGRVIADRTLVRQLLTNLIGNAVKYVAPGVAPHITLGSAPVEGMLEIWVSDNGIGIPDQDLGRVFDSFFRAGSTQDYPGTGLGLAICARTVERHGGRISARQGLGGEGTTMIFTLPLDPSPETSTLPDLEPLSAS
ncbi:MAG: ATP-binding protein [Marmoricola sp.]